MRAVEREPWVKQRSSRHDEICAAIVKCKDMIFPDVKGDVMVTAEAPCGRGYCDVLAVTDAPPGEQVVAIIEVKTNDERASTGDTIRQLRWYRQNLTLPRGVKREDVQLILVTENILSQVPDTLLTLCENAGVEVVPAFYFEDFTTGKWVPTSETLIRLMNSEAAE